MVAGLPKPRGATDEDARRLADAGARSAEIARQLEALVDADAASYEHVMAAYRLPKSNDEEKAARLASIQAALVGAIEPPIDVMRACAAAIDQAAVVAALGNRNASSDVLVALELLGAGIRGAKLNAEINLVPLKDAGRGEILRSVLATLTTVSETGIAAARARLADPA